MVSNVIIEVVGACNLRCPSCPNGNAQEVEHPTGTMDADLFARILDRINADNPHPDCIYLYNWGEPFLHPDLATLVRLVKERRWGCALSSNLNAWRNVDEVLQANPDSLTVSLSGFSQETYGVTHAGGNADTVIANLRRLRAALTRLRSSTRVAVRYLTYTHNTGEDFDAIRALCKELSFDFNPGWAFLAPVETLLKHYRGEVLPEAAQRVLELLAIKPAEARSLIPGGRSQHCPLRESQLAINSDGSVHLCCGAWGSHAVVARDYTRTTPEQLLRSKPAHPLCPECMAHAIPDYFAYTHPHRLDAIAADRLTALGKPVRAIRKDRSPLFAFSSFRAFVMGIPARR